MPAATGRRWIWPAIAALIACVPFVRGISLSNIFYVRDLTMFFWPRHLWIRETLLSGSWPLWDPYAAAGQAAFPDALNQLFLPPVLLLRLLPPVVGFNLIVALPFPLAAWGTWLFLRRHASPLAATAGALAFALSGPVLSTSNFPNLSWSIAWLPWILWAVDRDLEHASRRRFACVAAFVALQIVSGEPVTMTATVALAAAYAAVSVGGGWSSAIRAAARVVLAVILAAVASAVQLVPMMLAARTSPRGLMRVDNFWSLHPLWLINALLPHVLGDALALFDRDLPWMRPLNSNRDPFFYSLYLGPVVLLLSVLGFRAASRTRRWLWGGVIVVGLVLAFGGYTPIYVAVQQLVPVVRSFRFPVKFLLFAAFALAALVAAAVDAPTDAASRRTTLVTGSAVVVVLLALVSLVKVVPFVGARFFYDLATRVGVADPVAGAAFLFGSVPYTTLRVLAVMVVALLLVSYGWGADRHAAAARAILLAIGTADLVLVNAGVNPVFAAARLGPPEWVSALAAHPQDRFYFGGKFEGTLVGTDPDLTESGFRSTPGLTPEEARMTFVSNTALSPSAWHVRELLSYDLPQLWSVNLHIAEEMFEFAPRDQRMRFLARTGVRYCLLATPPPGGAPLVRAQVAPEFGAMAIYECVPDAQRAIVVDRAIVVPDVRDALRRLFAADFDGRRTMLVSETPPAPPSSPAGAPGEPSAHIMRDGPHDVTVDAVAGPGGGYLVLLDTFDPAWRALVDGAAAPVVQANALFRAVPLPPGHHQVDFRYQPPITYSIALSLAACVALAWLSRF
jgi:hypothetical protein